MTMTLVTAIIRTSVVERVEERLRDLGVNGITVTKVRGFGEYMDFYREDWLSESVRIDIYTSTVRAETVATVIAEAAHTGVPGDGFVALLPVERLLRVREYAPASEGA